MALPDVSTVVKDPDFLGLPSSEQQKVLQTIDPDFAGLPGDEQLKALAGLTAGSSTTTTPTTTVQSTPTTTSWQQRAGDYVLKRGDDFMGSMERLTGFGPSMGTEGPARLDPEAGDFKLPSGATYMPQATSPTRTALDVANVAGTVTAPGIMGLGVAAGAGAAALGADQDLAGWVDIATSLGIGGVQSAMAIRNYFAQQGINSAREAAAFMRQRVGNLWGQIGDIGNAGRITNAADEAEATARVSNLFGNLDDATNAARITQDADAAQTTARVSNLWGNIDEATDAGRITGAAARDADRIRAGAAAGQGAAGISDAAATENAVQRINALQSSTRGPGEPPVSPVEGGAAIQDTLPGVESARRSTFQEGMYDKIGKYAADRGLDATAQNPVGQQLAKRLTTAEDEWGPLATTAERKQVAAIQAKLAEEGGRVSWADLDAAEKALQRVKGPSSVRAALAEAKAGLLKGTPAEKALAGANQQWRMFIVPAKNLAKKIKTAGSPAEAFYRTFGSGRDPQSLEWTRKLLESDHPEAWAKLVGGFFTDLAQKAKGDPAKMAKLWQAVRPGVRAQIDPEGLAAAAFEDFTTAGSRPAPRPVEMPDYVTNPPLDAPTPRSLPTRPELPPETPRSLPERPEIPEGGLYYLPTPQYPPSAPTIPTGVRRTAELYSYGTTGLTAIKKFQDGDWQGGLAALGLGSLLGAAARRPDIAVRVLQAGAPAAARAGLVATGTAFADDE